MTNQKRLERLEAAVNTFSGDTGPGRWRVAQCEDGTVALIYELPLQKWAWPFPTTDFTDPTDPWTHWGGLEIIRRSGLQWQDDMCEQVGRLYVEVAILA